MVFYASWAKGFFEIVNVERSDRSIDVWLDERREKLAEDKYHADIVEYGYTSYCVIQDHLMRGVPMFLQLRKCRWLEKKRGVTFTYDIDYGEEKETRLSAELVAFFNQKVKTESLPIKTIASLYGVNGKTFADLYKSKLSGFME